MAADNRLNLVEGTGINLTKDVQAQTLTINTTINNVELSSPNESIDIHSSVDSETNTKTFTLDVNGGGELPHKYFLHDAVNIDLHPTYQNFEYEYTFPNDFVAGVGYVMNVSFQIQRPTNKSWNIGDTAVPIYFGINSQNGTSVKYKGVALLSNINGSYANYLASISVTMEFSPTEFTTYRKLYFDIMIPSAYRSTVDQLYFIADMSFVESP